MASFPRQVPAHAYKVSGRPQTEELPPSIVSEGKLLRQDLSYGM